jgi:hypothetical protein
MAPGRSSDHAPAQELARSADTEPIRRLPRTRIKGCRAYPVSRQWHITMSIFITGATGFIGGPSRVDRSTRVIPFLAQSE